MAWTAQKQTPDIVDGQIYQAIRYSNGVDPTVEEVYRTFPVPADWPDAIGRAKLAQLNAPSGDLKQQRAKLVTGDLLPAPAPIPQTPEQLAQQAWLMAYRAWVQVKKAVVTPIGTKKQADIDAARSALDALPYLDTYEALL